MCGLNPILLTFSIYLGPVRLILIYVVILPARDNHSDSNNKDQSTMTLLWPEALSCSWPCLLMACVFPHSVFLSHSSLTLFSQFHSIWTYEGYLRVLNSVDSFSFSFYLICSNVQHSFIFNFFLPSHMACGILVPQPGIKSMSPALEAQNPNHWTPGKSQHSFIEMPSSLNPPAPRTLAFLPSMPALSQSPWTTGLEMQAWFSSSSVLSTGNLSPSRDLNYCSSVPETPALSSLLSCRYVYTTAI